MLCSLALVRAIALERVIPKTSPTVARPPRNFMMSGIDGARRDTNSEKPQENQWPAFHFLRHPTII